MAAAVLPGLRKLVIAARREVQWIIEYWYQHVGIRSSTQSHMLKPRVIAMTWIDA